MTLSPKTLRIAAALFLSLVFIAAGYYFSSPLRTSIANATSTEEILKAYAAKDTDSDGLADWQESLYGTDLTNPHSVDPNLTDKEAVDQGKIAPKFKSEPAPSEKVTTEDIPGAAPTSGSLTDRFAKTFFEKFMLSAHPGTAPTEEEVQKFVEDAIAELNLNTSKTRAYSEKNLNLSGTGEPALREYAVRMEHVMAGAGGELSKDELAYLHDALINNDLEALAKISTIADAYKRVAESMRTVPVPQEASAAHLELMNTSAVLSEALRNMAAFREDPIRTFLGLEEYSPAGIRLVRAFASLYVTFQNAGISLSDGEAGYKFYALLGQAATAASALPTP